ncbi:MAG: prephenate dehydratase [Clostridia bacterium]|nr:prephenate dehydratase [Clostridia bacterium]
MRKIGFLGPKGTFSHEAALEYIKKREIGYTACDFNSITDTLLAVQRGEIHEAIVPIENSLEGAINVTLDTIAFDVDLKIMAEEIIAVRPNLLVKKGTRIEDIKCILSHPQPIGQCIKYIGSRFPGAQVKSVYSTVGAVEEVLEGNGDLAAIGTIAAAEAYGLDILDRNIQDGENNFTRFVVVSGQDSERTGDDKTSIVFSTENKPGSLYRILDIFNLWDINMTRIESRPAKNQLGRYIFFVDIIGHRSDDDVRDALTMVQKKTSFYKFLGSYPVFRS